MSATKPEAVAGNTILGPKDEAVLRALARYSYLTGRQVCRLLYSSGSLTYVQSKLKKLERLGYCRRIWLPKRGPFGSAPGVYTLARGGINHLKGMGIDFNQRFRPSEQESRSFLFLTHTLELNDFLISAELLGRWAPEFKLAAVLHERQLKQHPVFVKDGDRKRVAVIPDAWLDLRIQGTFQVCIAVELDRGTEEQRKWRRKVANLVAYANGPYQSTFETRSLTIAVLTTAGEYRLRELLRWTSAELEELGERSRANLFVFAHIPAEAMDAERVFLTPCWYQPFKPDPVALLDTTWAT